LEAAVPLIFGGGSNRPATHALVIGVSAYRHAGDGDEPTPVGQSFEIESLTSAARSASEFAGWLLETYRNPKAPLSSLHVLLSPSQGEIIDKRVQALLPAKFSAGRSAVEEDLKAFRALCDSSRANVGIVYLAGHGVQLTKHGAVVLLEDFGSSSHLTRLEGAIDAAGCHDGMNHPGTAQTQFWFVDACRQVPKVAQRFESLAGALTLDEPIGQADVSPLFLAASTREPGFGRIGGTSLFWEALQDGLSGAAAQGPVPGCNDWHVSVSTLIPFLESRVKRLAAKEGEDQNVDVTGRVAEAVIHRFQESPLVDLQLDIRPSAAARSARASLLLNAKKNVLNGHRTWPLKKKLPAGLYLLKVAADAPYHSLQDILNLQPPTFARSVEVEA
jgi:hypothetical protein